MNGVSSMSRKDGPRAQTLFSPAFGAARFHQKGDAPFSLSLPKHQTNRIFSKDLACTFLLLFLFPNTNNDQQQHQPTKKNPMMGRTFLFSAAMLLAATTSASAQDSSICKAIAGANAKQPLKSCKPFAGAVCDSVRSPGCTTKL
jgi:hypothetical protein